MDATAGDSETLTVCLSSFNTINTVNKYITCTYLAPQMCMHLQLYLHQLLLLAKQETKHMRGDHQDNFVLIEIIFRSAMERHGQCFESIQLNILFDTVLQSYCAAQSNGALDNIPLTLGSKTKTVNLKVPLAFIIGDIQRRWYLQLVPLLPI